MGFLQRLTQRHARTEAAPDERPSRPEQENPPPLDSQVTQQAQGGEPRSRDGEQAIQLTGTTTFAKDAITALAERRRIADGGYLETEGLLQREEDNEVDPLAVAVHIEGDRIGYLPGPIAHGQQLTPGEGRPVRVQVFTERLPEGLRAEAWAWLGDEPPRWTWSEENRPPMSSLAKARARHDQRTEMVQEALAGGGQRSMEFSAGTVNGVHYLQLVEPIKELKREGRLEDALVLCYTAIAGAEGDRKGREPAPWYTEQAAIIHRKLGQRDEEIAVLERWLTACPEDLRAGSPIAERLAKLTRR